MNTPDSPDDPRSLAHRLTSVGHALHRRLFAQLRDSGIHPKTAMILAAVDGRLDAPWITDRLARGGKRTTALAERGWIARTDDGWTLTDEGRATLDRIDADRAAVLADVPAATLAQLRASLDEIATTLGLDDADHPGAEPGLRRFAGGPRAFGFGPGPFGPGSGRGFGPGSHGFGPGFGPGWRGFGPGFGPGDLGPGSRGGSGPGSSGDGPGSHGDVPDSRGDVPAEGREHARHDGGNAHHGFGPRHGGHADAHDDGAPGRHGRWQGRRREARATERAYERGFDAGFERGRESAASE
ncbi:MarR family winged helix-turn-helix transcriptional regulator [Microbacterium sp. NPDC090007]|uniref:MarR family winged helix-turn-helix transcriptional regulator n=1 Tax=Microbacterium sp. NPDC090007 TaxID=3364204 RepID=UPI0037F187CA